jgi:hypothetical protein
VQNVKRTQGRASAAGRLSDASVDDWRDGLMEAHDRRPAWQRGLAALASFLLAAVALLPVWWVVMLAVAYSWTDAVFRGMGTGGSRPTSWWWPPLQWSSLAVVVVIIFRITWKVWRHRA